MELLLKNIEYDKDADDYIEIMFNSKNSDYRKMLIENNINKNIDVDISNLHEKLKLDTKKFIHVTCNDKITISDFIRFDMVEFSIANCDRSIPHIMDGFKVSQRKIYYAVSKKKLEFNKEAIKVSQLSGYVAEKTNYHHGEQNLCETIVNISQDYTGSNNINLLYPKGQFGSRIQNGKDSASARYIFTKLNKYSRIIFNEVDDNIIEYVTDDGDVVEPKYYIPIIPMILVNGIIGIGTGYSTTILNYNVKEIIEYLLHWLKTDTFDDNIKINPWYRGFKGKINLIEDKYEMIGIYEIEEVNNKNITKIIVTEIPIGISIDGFKDSLDKLQIENKIMNYNNFSTENTVHYEIFIKNYNYDNVFELLPKLKSNNYSTTNMVMFNEEGRIKKFDDVYQIIKHFCRIRIDYYGKRKEYLLDLYSKELIILSNKYRFILAIINEEIIIFKKSTDEIVIILEEQNYDKIDNNYDYLLNMTVRSFTKEKLTELKKLIDNKTKIMKGLSIKSSNDLWLEDLQELYNILDKDKYFENEK